MNSPATREEHRAAFRPLGRPIVIRSTEPRVIEAFRQLYQRCPESAPPGDAYTVSLAPASNGEGFWSLASDDGPSDLYATLADALQYAERRFCAHVLRASPDWIGIHGGTVGFGDRKVLIVGDSGAGKTTLTLTLRARGYPVEGDDMAMLEPSTGRVVGLPRCFHLDERSIGLLGQAGLDVRAKEVYEGFLTPFAVGDGGGAPRPVGAIFFLMASEGSEPVIRPVDHAEAVGRLDAQTGPRLAPSSELFAAFARMLSTARCFELRRGELSATADRLIRAVEAVG